MDFKKSLKDVLVLFVICIVFAGALAGTNELTKGAIAQKKSEAEDAAYEAVMPNAAGYNNIDITGKGLSSTIVEIKEEKSGLGYVVKLNTSGYQPGMVILIAVNTEGSIIAATTVESNETWGLESEMNELVVGKDSNTIVDVKAGVTSMTVNGYRGAVRDALNALIILGLTDGEVDDRTPEQILQDNLNGALPAANGEFTKLDVNVITNDGKIYTYADLDVDAIYEADNGAGFVYVIGKSFIAVDANGIVGEATEEEKTAIESAEAIIGSTLVAEEIDITEYKDSADRATKTAFKYINSVKKTEAGVYVVETSVKGYSSAPTPMNIVVTVGTDGTIVDFAVISHSETGSYGGEKIESGYYDEFFIGKDQTECGEVDFKNGATETSNGVKKAINYGFVAVNAIEENSPNN